MGETVTVNDNQSYDFWFTTGRRDKKVCNINYYFHGEGWSRVWAMMKNADMRASEMLFYTGAKIDPKTALIEMCGGFRMSVVKEKHHSFWKAFFKKDPTFNLIGKGIKMPSSGDLDEINIFVDGVKC